MGKYGISIISALWLANNTVHKSCSLTLYSYMGLIAALEGCWVPSVQVRQAKVNGNLLRQQRSMEILKRAIAGILM